jgi:hypothetical protein
MFEQPGFQTIEPPNKRAYFQTKHVSTRFCLRGRGVESRSFSPPQVWLTRIWATIGGGCHTDCVQRQPRRLLPKP